jgi:hypothetical protein
MTENDTELIDDLDNVNTEVPDVADDAVDEMSERKKEAQALAKELVKKIEVETPGFIATDQVNFVQSKGIVKKQTKPQLIASILKLQEELNIDEPRPKSHFDRMNKPDLIEYLGFLTNKGASILRGVEETPKDYKNADESSEPQVQEAIRLDKKKIDSGAKALFQFNMIMVKVAELTSVNFKESIGTDLKGLSDDCMANREQLEEILAQIYEENRDTLSEYISPLNQYFLMMTSLGTHRAILNRSRVEEELKKKPAGT